MKTRNEALHADVARYVDLRMQMDRPKTIAARNHTSPEVVRALICREVQRRKLTNVKIHVEPTDAKMEGEC